MEAEQQNDEIMGARTDGLCYFSEMHLETYDNARRSRNYPRDSNTYFIQETLPSPVAFCSKLKFISGAGLFLFMGMQCFLDFPKLPRLLQYTPLFVEFLDTVCCELQHLHLHLLQQITGVSLTRRT